MRTFLDTNIIWYIDWLGPLIFDGDDSVLDSETFTKASTRQQREWMALVEITRWAQHVNPIFVISPTVVGELPQDRQAFGWEFYEWSREADEYCQHVPPNDADYRLLAALPDHELTSDMPDSNDRRLVSEAIFYACDSFLTMDQRTIWRHRRKLRHKLGIRVLRPSEMFNLIFRAEQSRSSSGGTIWVSRH